MGYPMTYSRVVGRNDLSGDYASKKSESSKSLIAGDMRRLEDDQRDKNHLELYAKFAEITTEQAKKVLDAFFDSNLLYNIQKDTPWLDLGQDKNYHGGD